MTAVRVGEIRAPPPHCQTLLPYKGILAKLGPAEELNAYFRSSAQIFNSRFVSAVHNVGRNRRGIDQGRALPPDKSAARLVIPPIHFTGDAESAERIHPEAPRSPRSLVSRLGNPVSVLAPISED